MPLNNPPPPPNIQIELYEFDENNDVIIPAGDCSQFFQADMNSVSGQCGFKLNGEMGTEYSMNAGNNQFVLPNGCSNEIRIHNYSGEPDESIIIMRAS